MNNITELLENQQATIIDVRNDWEYAEGHIKNAINIPLHEIPARLHELKNIKMPLVLYCRSGNRSGAAVHILKQAGFTEVYNGGGIFDMQQLTLN